MYKNSYVRTSATEYTRDSLDRAVHLVNDYVQKHEENYGKYEDSNKLSFDDFRAIMASHGKDFDKDVWPQIQEHTRHVFRATLSKFKKVDYSFELMGMDFMLDASFNVWLIEVSTLHVASVLVGPGGWPLSHYNVVGWRLDCCGVHASLRVGCLCSGPTRRHRRSRVF